jgi:prephenate dehydrogenase
MKLALIGCGLLGGSAAMAWRRAGRVDRVTVFDRDPDAARRALALGLAERAAPSIADAVADADCVLIATPVGAIAAVLAELARHARPEALITDVGSTKATVLASARALLGDGVSRFVPAHPIAGGELPGAEHASADLFAGRWLITTPDQSTGAAALARIESNWAACGARLARLTAAEHDRIFAAVSHMPHLLAFALVEQIAVRPEAQQMLRFAGAGFQDFTRIAASDPVMWRDIALDNRAALVQELAAYGGRILALQQALGAGDGDALERLFATASRVRRALRAEPADHADAADSSASRE